MISVNHNLSDRPDSKGVCAKHIQTPKTEAGTRTIPMIQEVFEAFLTEYEIVKKKLTDIPVLSLLQLITLFIARLL